VTDATPSCWICGADAAPDTRYPGLPLVRCGACGFLFAPVASAEELRRLYTSEYFDSYPGGRAYDADEAQRRHEAAVRLKWLRTYLSRGRLLEIGSASGWFLAQARDAGFTVEGIEPAADVASAATARWDVPVQAATAESASLPEGEFDAIVAWHALEHITAPAGVLERLHAALKPGGVLMIEVPNLDSAASRAQGAAWFHLDLAHHVGHYAPATLSELLRRTGFTPVQVDTFPTAGYLRPDLVRTPRGIAWQLKQAVQHRASPRAPHPTRHEMLRAVAVKGSAFEGVASQGDATPPRGT
jgi:2-polyprenyl-3-methyl-5-hydroxy-6-metoxy-1,4-benzoquinol methylase